MASSDTVENETLKDKEAAFSGSLTMAATDSGTVSAVVDAKKHLESVRSPNTIRPALGKMAKIFTVSGHFSEVNQEQIDRVRMSK